MLIIVNSILMKELIISYLPILIFLAIATAISVVMMLIPFVIAPKYSNKEKLSAYECGFEPFEDARQKFDIKFYLIAILFIVFDLEIAFLFPWAANLGALGAVGFWSMMVFLTILAVGFIYEWFKGALEWE